MVFGSFWSVVLRRLDRSTVYAWTVVLCNAGISIGCNALRAAMGESVELSAGIAMGVSAIPALNLALSVHLLVTLIDALVPAARPVPVAAV